MLQFIFWIGLSIGNSIYKVWGIVCFTSLRINILCILPTWSILANLWTINSLMNSCLLTKPSINNQNLHWGDNILILNSFDSLCVQHSIPLKTKYQYQIESVFTSKAAESLRNRCRNWTWEISWPLQSKFFVYLRETSTHLCVIRSCNLFKSVIIKKNIVTRLERTGRLVFYVMF